jgi:4-hydroxy-tetrahydrodipicolinate synthase
MIMLNEGLFCALGTPLDNNGNVIKESLCAHIESQISSGISGVLLMGTMGMLGCVRDSQYEEVVKCAVNAVKGRVPLMVGAADNSLARIRDRLEVLNRYDVAVVVTAPYYFALTTNTALTCIKAAAAGTKHDLYLYDHPYTARYKLNYQDVLELAKLPNIKGIKTGDAVLIRALADSDEIKKDFTSIFSNSDLFGMGWSYGIKRILDGIFACFPKTLQAVSVALKSGDVKKGCVLLNRMMAARDRMISLGIWTTFTQGMNLLGFSGNFAPDYEPLPNEKTRQLMNEIYKDLGEL